MINHHSHKSEVNRFFLKERKRKEQIDHIMRLFDQSKTRVGECIQKESKNIRKRHPEWSNEVVLKKAQTACGQSPSVLIKDKKKKSISDESLNECVSRKISIIKEEHPEWKPEQIQAVAYNYCRENQKDHLFSTDVLLETYQLSHQLVPEGIDFVEYAGIIGYHSALEDSSICYKMENVEETDEEYIVPVVLAKAMVQPYPAKEMIMAKLPKDLQEAKLVDYETGKIVDILPTFEFHPEEEIRENENGYVTDIKYQSDKERIVGILHVLKKKLSDNLRSFFERREPIHVSIGFMYLEGPGGEFRALSDSRWNGEKYNASQQNILITHLALLPPNKSRGRCPLPYCGVGLNINDSIPLENIPLKSIVDINISTDTYRNNSDIIQLKEQLRKHFILLANALR